MIRGRRKAPGEQGEPDFRWRAQEVTRLEGFSDAVFAFAVTLLVVSLEVPKTYDELMHAMRGFLSFGVCFALLANIWNNHCRFFRRYGLVDSAAVTLNCLLLFFVLFYVYPMKFLFVVVFSGDNPAEPQQVRMLFTIFGAGYALVFFIFALLYAHAWRRRGELALNPVECLKTKHSLYHQVAMVIIGSCSVALAWSLPLNLLGLAGYFYFVNLPYFTVSERWFGKQQRELAAQSVH
jgi:uncharacterized membrane protein